MLTRPHSFSSHALQGRPAERSPLRRCALSRARYAGPRTPPRPRTRCGGCHAGPCLAGVSPSVRGWLSSHRTCCGKTHARTSATCATRTDQRPAQLNTDRRTSMLNSRPLWHRAASWQAGTCRGQQQQSANASCRWAAGRCRRPCPRTHDLHVRSEPRTTICLAVVHARKPAALVHATQRFNAVMAGLGTRSSATVL